MRTSQQRIGRPGALGAKLALTAAALLACAGVLGGCSEESQAERAIRDAGAKLEGMTADGRAVATSEKKRSTLVDVRDSLAKFKDTESKVVAGPVNMMLAKASSELAELDLARAVELQNTASVAASNALSTLIVYSGQAAAAGAAAKVDVSAELAKLAESRAAQQAALTKVSGDVTARTGEQTGLAGQAAKLMDDAKALRRQATELRAQGAGKSATVNLDIVTRAAEISKRADALERQSAGVQTNAASAQGRVDDAARMKSAAERTIKLIEDSSKGLTSRQTQSREEATQTKADAEKLAGQFKAELGTVEKMWDSGVAPLLDSAEKNARDAVGASRKAVSAGSGPDANVAKLGGAMHQQVLANVLMTRAAGALAHARLLNVAAETAPALPDQSALKASAQKSAADAKAAVEAAQAAYKEAKEAFEGAGSAAGESRKTVMEQLGQQLNTLANERGNAKPAAEGAVEKAPAGAPVTDSTAAGPIAAVKARMGEMKAAAASGDQTAIAKFMKLPPEMEKIAAAQKRLDDACQAKFGKTLAEVAGPQGAAMMSQMGGGASAFASMDPERFDYAVKDPAHVTMTPKPGQPGKEATWELADGQWRLDVSAAMGDMSSSPVGKMMGSLGPVMDDAATQVTSGTLATEQQLMQFITKKLQAAMMSGMGGMGGGMPTDPNK
ncbi:hypothetical protein BH11PLA1_BH11PLA1_20790 [soil metagenome]